MMRGRLWWAVVFSFAALVAAAPAPTTSATSCPLNFTVLDDSPSVMAQVRVVDAVDKKCLTLSHAVDVLLSVFSSYSVLMSTFRLLGHERVKKNYFIL